MGAYQDDGECGSSQSQKCAGPHNLLWPKHRKILEEGSGISPEIIRERGVRTVTGKRGSLPNIYSWRQKKRGAGILFTVHRPNTETATIFRPDKPDGRNGNHKYEQECKALGGSGNTLDVHPRNHHLISNTSVPVIIVEGIKKSDSVSSAAAREGISVLPVGISGVWNWRCRVDGKSEPIPDLEHVPLEGRSAMIAYDRS